MMFKFITVVILLTSPCLAQPEPAPGARSAALGGASVCLSDVWSMNNNPSGLAWLKKSEAGTWYQDPYGVKALQQLAFAFTIPGNHGSFGILASAFGFEEYQEKTMNLGYARAFGKQFSGGISLNYLNTYIAQGYGTANSLTGTLGFQARIHPQLYLAASLYNPTRSNLDSRNEQLIPSLLRIGILYFPNKKVCWMLETEKNTTLQPAFKTGIEYQPNASIALRTGLSTPPYSCSLGLGIHYQSFRFDFSNAWQPTLGFLPGIGLCYSFPGKNSTPSDR